MNPLEGSAFGSGQLTSFLPAILARDAVAACCFTSGGRKSCRVSVVLNAALRGKTTGRRGGAGPGLDCLIKSSLSVLRAMFGGKGSLSAS